VELACNRGAAIMTVLKEMTAYRQAERRKLNEVNSQISATVSRIKGLKIWGSKMAEDIVVGPTEKNAHEV
jgi:predicted transglutaminase-like cysteine proteinase